MGNSAIFGISFGANNAIPPKEQQAVETAGQVAHHQQAPETAGQVANNLGGTLSLAA